MPVLKIKKNGKWDEVWGSTSSGGGGGAPYPKLLSVTMLANAWVGESSPYSQTVVINGVDANSKIDLQPTPQVINTLQNLGTSLMAVNDNCVVTIWAIGNKPDIDISTDVLITDINVV